MKIVIVMPIFKEGDNIVRMIDALGVVFPEIPNHTMELLLVDGNSKDGTEEIAQKMAITREWLHIIVEPEKRGIGAAYFYGFNYAMHELRADAVVEMDGDFQHDPNDLIALVAPLDKGFDYVIGSRYIKGGSIPKEWEFYRKFLSVGGSIFTKLVLGIFTINDFTTGYKVTRVKNYLDKIDFSKIKNRGFGYKVELLYIMYKMKAKIIEVPIQFGLRDRGDSKMESDNFFDILILVLTLRLQKNKEFVKFALVGGLGFVTDSTIFNLLSLGIFVPKIAALVSGFVAMTTTFILNNKWSFKERKITSFLEVFKNILLYFFVSIIPILFRSKIVSQFDIWYGHNFWIYNSAFILGVIIGLIWNYIMYSKIIWRKK